MGSDNELESKLIDRLFTDAQSNPEYAKELLATFVHALDSGRAPDPRIMAYVAQCFARIVFEDEKPEKALNLARGRGRPSTFERNIDIAEFVYRGQWSQVKRASVIAAAREKFGLSESAVEAVMDNDSPEHIGVRVAAITRLETSFPKAAYEAMEKQLAKMAGRSEIPPSN